MVYKIENPINSEYDVELVDSIPCTTLIRKYNEEFNQDVSKYFTELESVFIYECTVTKYRFYYPYVIIGDDSFYEGISINKTQYYHSRWEHNLALKYSGAKSKWLEVGSGNSYFLKQLFDKGVNAVGLELNKNEVEAGNKKNLRIINQDFFSFHTSGKKFNVIALFQVLEHMYKISDFFEKAYELLESNGRIIFSVPNSNPHLFVFDKYHTLNLPPHHMGLWDIKSVKLVGKEFGFRVIDRQTEKLSHSEFEYMINLKKLSQLLILDQKIAFVKFFYRILPGRLKLYWSNLCRNKLLQGRNIFVVLEKI
ncbi:class I SAM-dependent methyltransferase [Algoriphagus sp. C2-6-M1]|uniref:class I SAM-dependent methyltransferase n=1 Tax=Algoriphagus persicinus TaxID=3108754 RepID=UPI002B3692B7|nr:class I SAM-dependent methyltransferase [Algoriphagus sp. C2-6-M1]MEB2782426.1 class I SAM-dependent methyltransferase [Algoriphagus sp. C2-6-M1]